MLSAEGAPAGAVRDGLVEPRRVFHRVPGTTREQVLEEVATRLAAEGCVGDARDLVSRLIDRERIGCTGLGHGVAIPHCKIRDLRDVVVAVATTATPVDFGAADGIPIDVIFLVASPADAPAAHLQTLARISRLLKTPGVLDGLRAADSQAALVAALRDAEARQGVAS